MSVFSPDLPPISARLVARSALKLDTLETLVIAWPESFSAELDTLLGEAPEARRVILSWDPHGLDRFHRAPRAPCRKSSATFRSTLPGSRWDQSRRYATRLCRPLAGRVAVRDVLDAVRSVRPYVWKGGDVVAPPWNLPMP